MLPPLPLTTCPFPLWPLLACRSCRKASAHSTWGKGKTAPDQSGNTPLPGEPEIMVPMGKGIDQRLTNPSLKQSALLYDEFIVYSESQVKQKYVLTVKFKYKSTTDY